MAIKEGMIVYSHVGIHLREGVLITHFGCKTLEDALKYCRGPPSSDLAEIKYGTFEDDGWNKREVGTPKLIGTFKRSKYKGKVNYSFTMNGYRYPVGSDGSLGTPTKLRKKTEKTGPFGL